MTEAGQHQDIAALAKGGRTNFLGFLLRLAARLPFLLIAGRMYGAASLGRFASAMVVIELAGQLCTLGQKRGLAQRLSEDERNPDAESRPANVVADAMVLSSLLALLTGLFLFTFPKVMYPRGEFSEWDLLLPLAILPTTLTDVALSALAYRYDVATTVRSRSVVEPWTLSIAAGLLFFVVPEAGLPLSYLASIVTSGLVAWVALLRSYGLPRQWLPHPARIGRLALANLPLAAADAVEWGTRKLDIFILRFFVSDEVVGIYFVAQQVASLPQKLKTSFEPILGPVITRNLHEKNYPAIARQVRQVGFWIIAAQAGVALALGLPGEGVMGLVGPTFVGGTAALAFLLAAEVVAATAVVSEAALIYMARFRNLVVSLGTIALQAALTLAGIELVKDHGLSPLYMATIPAAALMVTLATASLIKSRILGDILGESVNNWRWPLAWAAIPAIAVGGVATGFLPEWAELLFGIPAILATYVWIIWHKGFGPEDRVLFRKNVGA
ncbi:MAG: oligosaccharide flippase family protein [Novosphingobium sp.]